MNFQNKKSDKNPFIQTIQEEDDAALALAIQMSLEDASEETTQAWEMTESKEYAESTTIHRQQRSNPPLFHSFQNFQESEWQLARQKEAAERLYLQCQRDINAQEQPAPVVQESIRPVLQADQWFQETGLEEFIKVDTQPNMSFSPKTSFSIRVQPAKKFGTWEDFMGNQFDAFYTSSPDAPMSPRGLDIPELRREQSLVVDNDLMELEAPELEPSESKSEDSPRTKKAKK